MKKYEERGPILGRRSARLNQVARVLKMNFNRVRSQLCIGKKSAMPNFLQQFQAFYKTLSYQKEQRQITWDELVSRANQAQAKAGIYNNHYLDHQCIRD